MGQPLISNPIKCRLLALFLLLLTTCAWSQESGATEAPEEAPTTEVLTLSEALITAVLQHPDLQEGEARVEAAEFSVTASTAPRYPRFSFNASAGQSGSSGQGGGANVIRTGLTRSYGYGITLSQQIFDFGRTRHSVHLSELQLGVTRLNYLSLRQSVLDNVVQAYFELLRQDQAIEVNLANVRNAQRILDRANGFLEAGTGAKIAVIQAEADLANAEFGLIQAQGGYDRARVALAQTMGLDDLGDVVLEETYLEVPDWDTDIVRHYAQLYRLDVATASLGVAQAETRIQLAKSEYFPSVSANAGYNWNDQIFPPQNTSYNVGLSLSVPLINEPALSSAVGIARANHKAELAVFRKVELQAVKEALSSFSSLEEAKSSAASASESLRFATENFRLASERYEVGVGSVIEVSQAQRQLVEARSRELQARFNVQTAVATLLRDTGRLDAQALLPEELAIDPVFDLPDIIVPEKLLKKEP